MSFCKPSAFVLCQMCPFESKLSSVHIWHNPKSHFVPLAKQHRAINIKNTFHSHIKKKGCPLFFMFIARNK